MATVVGVGDAVVADERRLHMLVHMEDARSQHHEVDAEEQAAEKSAFDSDFHYKAVVLPIGLQ